MEQKETVTKTSSETEKIITSYIYYGIATAIWKGRMELVNEHPFFLIDGAHNAHGVLCLMESKR